MAQLWQHPFVNLFKQFSISTWMKSTKEGEVVSVMDRNLKGMVYRISGSVPAANFIHLPKSNSQSLSLTGRYLYLLLKPVPGKYFVVHIDTTAVDGVVVRISFSNLFKEFKATSTWLQFPYICNPAKGSVCAITTAGSVDISGPAPQSVRWTVLCFDLQQVLALFANKKYLCLKSIRLCANLCLKNLFTSDLLFEPGVSVAEGKKMGLHLVGLTPMPREMAFPLQKGSDWHDHYDLIRFPAQQNQSNSANVIKYNTPQANMSTSKHHIVPSNGSITENSPSKREVNVSQCVKDRVSWVKKLAGHQERDLQTNSVRHHRAAHKLPGKNTHSNEVHVLTHSPEKLKDNHSNCNHNNNINKKTQCQRQGSLSDDIAWDTSVQTLEPDPILKMKRIVGFGGSNYSQLLWTADSKTVVYPCQSTIVVMDVVSQKQRLFIGHTDKVSCLSITSDSALLASGQTGPNSEVCIWKFESGNCIAWSQVHNHSLSNLSFSPKGTVLCGVGKDAQNRNLAVVWDTSHVKQNEIRVLAKAHTSIDIHKMIVCPFDENRLVSCGQENIRFWRLKGHSLYSVSVNIGEYQDTNFTDLAFVPEDDPNSQKLFVSSETGYILELDYQKMTVKHVRRLLPSEARNASTKCGSEGIPINSICVHETFCVTGSEDGYLCLWALDFAYLYMEAEHQGPVSAVQFSPDGLKILTGTKTGHLGILDVTTRKYKTIMRSHTDQILNACLSSNNCHLITVSSDMSVRIWDSETLQQLYDFSSADNCPVAISCSPSSDIFACGFSDGTIRIFDVTSNSILYDLSVNKKSIVSLLYSPTGCSLYSACVAGMLVRWKVVNDDYKLMISLPPGSLACQNYVHNVMAISPDGLYVAFIGPSPYTITVVGSNDLRECWVIDISHSTGSPSSAFKPIVDMAENIFYTPATHCHLLVSTSNKTLLKFDALTGCLLSEFANIQGTLCRSIAFIRTGQHMVTAGEKMLKVWDYKQADSINHQTFIGHAGDISKVLFTNCGGSLFSVGDAIYQWEYLGPKPDSIVIPSTPINSFRQKDTPKEGNVNQNCSLKDSEPFLQPHVLLDETADHTPRRCAPLPARQQEAEKSIVDRNLFSPVSDNEEEEEVEIETEEQPNDPATKNEDEEATNLSSSIMEMYTDLQQLKILSKQAIKPTKVSVHKHYVPKNSIMKKHKQQYYLASPEQSGMSLKQVLGYDGNGRNNLVWKEDWLVYSLGCIIVVQDILSGEQTHLTGHPQEVSTLAIRRDRKMLASASRGFPGNKSEILVWDLVNMNCLGSLNFHENNITSLAFSADNRYLVSVGDFNDPHVVVWNTNTQLLEVSSLAEYPIHEVCWDPQQCSSFTTVGENGTVLFWMVDEKTDQRVELLLYQPKIGPQITEMTKTDTESSLNFTCITYADSVAFIGNDLGFVTAWNTNNNQCFLCWEVDNTEIGVLACNCQYLVTGSVGQFLKLWSIANICLAPENSDPQVVMECQMRLDGAIIAAAFDDDFEMGVVGTDSGTIFCVNWTERSSIHLVSGHMKNVTGLAVSPNSDLISSCNDGVLRVWNRETWEMKAMFCALSGACTCVSVSPSMISDSSLFEEEMRPANEKGTDSKNSTSLVAAGYSNGVIRLFDINNMEQLFLMHPHASSVTAITFSPDSHTILSGAVDGLVAISNPRTGMTIRVITAQQGATITSIDAVFRPETVDVGFPANILWLITSADRRVSVWASNWGQDICEPVDWLTFPATTNGTDQQREDLNTDPSLGFFPPSLARFAPENPEIVVYAGCGNGKILQFYDLVSKKVKFSHPLSNWSQCLDLSPTDPFIVLGGGSGFNIQLMDFYEGSFQDFLGHNDSLHTVKFSPDGCLLFTAAANEIFVWEMAR